MGRIVAAVAATIASSSIVLATNAQKTWDAGNASNKNFYNNVNWDNNTIPTWTGDTDYILFNGAGSGDTITLNVNGGLTEYLVKSWTFTSGAYTFNGSQNLTFGDATTKATNTGNLVNSGTGLVTFNPTSTIAFRFGTINAASGAITFGANPTINIGNNSSAGGRSVTVDGTANVTINGLLAGTGDDTSAGGYLAKIGSNTLFLNGNSTAWNGRVQITDGAVRINKANSLGSTAGRTTIDGGASAGRLEITGGITVAEGLYLGGRAVAGSPHLRNVSGNNILAGALALLGGGTEYGIDSAAGALTLTGNVVYDTAAGATNLRLSGAGTGVFTGLVGAGGLGVSIIKEGTGTWTLDGAQDFAGSTQINQGRLNLSTFKVGNAAITVGDGATLGVSLATAGQSLSTTALTLGATTGATLALDLGSLGTPVAPVINAGLLSTGGVTAINIKGGGLSVAPFTLIKYTGSIGGAGYAGLSLGALPARVTASLVDDAANSAVLLNVTAFDVPKWVGGTDTVWDIDDGTGTGTLNWKEKNSGIATRYLQGAGGTDSVIFDDTPGVPTSVFLAGDLTPVTATVNSDVNAFVFGGSGKLSGAASLIKQGASTLTLANTGGNDNTGTTTISGGALQVGDGVTASAGQLGTGQVVNNASLVLNRPDALTVSADISGSGSITQLGAGVTTLSGNNSFAGVVTVAAGTLKLGKPAALGATTAGTAVQDGATLDVNNQTLPAGEVITISGGGVGGAGALINSGSGSSAAGPRNLVLAASASIGGSGRFDVRGAGASVDAAGFTLTKVGSNTIFLSNVGETHLGDVIVNAGRLSFEGTSTLGDKPGSITVNSGGQIGFESSTVTHTKAINLFDGQLYFPNGTTNAIAGPITITGAALIQGGGDLVVSSGITGTGALEKKGTGTLILSGANAYEGTTTISAGTLRVGNDGTSGSLPAGDVINNSTLTFRRSDAALVVANNIGGSGAVNIGASGTTPGAALVTLTGNNSFGGGINVNGGQLKFGTAAALPTTGSIAIGSNGALVVSGPHSDVTSWLSSGRITTASAGALALAEPASSENINLGGYAALSIGAAGGSSVVYTGTITPGGGGYFVGGGGGTISLASANAFTGANNLTIGNGGGGTVVVGAANNLTGGTTVNAGTVRLGAAGALGGGRGALTLGANITVDLNANNLSVGVLTASSGAIVTDNAAAPGVTTFSANTPAGSTTFSGGVRNGAVRTLAFVKDGPGTLVFSRPNGSEFPEATINAGRLEIRTNNANVFAVGTGIKFTGSGTLALANNTTVTTPVAPTFGALTLVSGEATIESNNYAGGAGAQVATFAAVPARPSGATLNLLLTSNGSTAATASTFKVAFTTAPAIGSSLDGGIFFNSADFAAYDTGGYARALVYGSTDVGAVDLNLSASAATLGAVSGLDVQLRGGFSVTAQPTESIRTLKIADASNLTLDAGAILTLSSGGLLKTGGNASVIDGGAGGGIATSGGDLVVRVATSGDVLTISAPILPSVAGGITKVGSGTLVLGANNASPGDVRVYGGVLRASDVAGLPLVSGLVLDGGVFETAANLSRALGSGAGKVLVKRGNGGFSAAAPAVSVDLSGTGAGSAYTLVWGGANFDPGTLVLNEATATGSITLANGLDLNSTTARTIAVNAGTATLAGPVTATGGGTLVKSGVGTLRLTAAGNALGTLQAIGGGASTIELAGASTTTASNVTVGQSTTGTLNIKDSATLAIAGNYYLGNSASTAGTVNQSGGAVTAAGQVRVGHYPTETSVYNHTGGTLTLTGTSATAPFTTGAAEVPGTLYIGIDGTGTFNHSGGNVAAEGLVLDNRGATAGTDTYNLTGGKLTLGKWGISGNATAGSHTTAINLGGGTVSASADWTSTLDATLTGAGGHTTFDPNGQTIMLSGVLSGTGGLTKSGAGTLVLAGNNAFTGPVTVNAGTLEARSNAVAGLPAGASVAFTGKSSLVVNNNGAGIDGTLSLGTLSLNAGDVSIESRKGDGSSASNTLTLAVVPVRAAGATGNFTLSGTTDPSNFRVVITAAPAAGQSINGGLHFNGDQFAGYDAAGHVRGLDCTTDSNATDVILSADQPTLGVVTGKDVQLGGGNFGVTAQTTESIRTLRVAGASNLTITDGQTLTVTGGGIIKTGGNAATISGGGVATGGAGDLVVRTAQAADTLTITSAVNAPGGLTKSGPGTLVLSGNGSYPAGLWVNDGTLEIRKSLSASELAVRNAQVKLVGSGGGSTPIPTVKTLSLSGGKLDIADQGIVVDFDAGGPSPLGSVVAAVLAGYAGGAWNGNGIVSTTALAQPNDLTIGVAERSAIGNPSTFLGQPLSDDTAILVRLTLKGDVNLDGTVNFDDLVAVAQNYESPATNLTWSSGDFDYDGAVNFSDLVSVAQHYENSLSGSSVVPGASAGFSNAWAAAQTTAVPEPAAISLLVGLGGVLLERRRRHGSSTNR